MQAPAISKMNPLPMIILNSLIEKSFKKAILNLNREFFIDSYQDFGSLTLRITFASGYASKSSLNHTCKVKRNHSVVDEIILIEKC